MDYRGRRKKLQEWVKEKQLDALLVTSLINVRYLTGFTGSNGTVLMFPDESIFLTDGRYRAQAQEEVQEMRLNVVVGKSLPKQLIPLIPKGPFTLGIEADQLTVLQHGMLGDALGDDVQLEPTYGSIQQLRLKKDPEEADLIRKASCITRKVFKQIQTEITFGMTEKDVRRRMRDLIDSEAGEGESFDTIVLFGRRTALVHGSPKNVSLEKNDLILMDFGAKYGGYCSDFTRTFTLGKPSKSAEKAFALVKAAVEKAMDLIEPGAKCCEIEQSTREFFKKHGQANKYLHSLGHGVGLEIHESPRFVKTGDKVLQPGMVVTVEPGLYSKQWGGIRLENLLLITQDGYENLTPEPMQLRYRP